MAGTMTSPAKVGVGAIKTQFDDDVSKINQILTARLEAREFALLYTLLSTFIPQLCARFPDLKEHFFPTSPFRDYCSWSREPFDFGPHHHSVTWPRQLYLRHLVVLDLEKLCTRARQSRGSCHAGRAPVVTTRRDGVFQRQFTPDRSNHNLTTIGVLDHLQRALLNQPGADRIQSMRIPTHRMRTFQLRQERVPRARERKGPPPLWQPYYPEDDEEAVAPSLEPSKSAPIEELNRPYCFTFNKLMHLRRFEVCDMTENECDWETLDRVLATLRFGHHLGKSHTEAEKTARGESVATCQLNRIQMFSLETQAPLTSHFSKVLSHFEHLEVLELKPACCQRPWFADSHPNLHRTLRVLRIGTTTFYREHTAAFEHLGQFFNLEELRIVVNSPHQFQWVVNTKKQFRLGQQQKQQQQCRSVNQVNRTGAGLGPAPITYIRDQDNPLQKCLPKLKRLGCSVEGDNQFVSVNTIIDAFGDQLEEFVVRVLNYAESSRFEHPFSQLRRLALRGDFLFRFDYESLAEQCPTLEMLALQHNRFLRSVADVQDDAAMVAALVKLTKLRCLYLEGLWPIDDIQLLKLVQERPSLYKIGIHYSENLTFAGMEQLDRILSARETKYPLKPKGLYRLPGYMSDFLAKDYVWRTTFFGHEDD
ncbi:hypothetical protein BC939DRAFT_448425 [Gamsiella multidivaricata]|uniref:uncharacterized protein n=1 Tax=Gamsiella multidivaricata TaxID=101098 RepID=UPI00221F9385|nr:uncharacterized protein BC939DRAFT_448425 [Gamsiella multidivaricata]KAG0370812.1 hypothetical protein BGZ54_003808 [Gamsiella multidivaricata]KAI7825283.1 hypothetical protein BC939DRAFT_448425 [Gamsiella multidivaricata]